MAGRITKLSFGAVTILLAGLIPASAQQAQAPAQQSAPAAPAQPPQQPAAPQVAMPDAYKLNTMIRTAIIALNQANQTGNYTVLRDLGTAAFRLTNDAARLAEVFSALRKRQLDLSPVLFFTPKLLQQPQMDPRGLIRLTGFFETAPERVNFDIYYLLETGQWRLFGIGVVMSPAETTSALPAGQAAPAADAKSAASPPAPSAAKSGTGEKPAKSSGASRPTPKPEPRLGGAAAPANGDKAAENKTTKEAARIQLSAPAPAAPAATPEEAPRSPAGAPAPKEKSTDGFPF